LWRNSAVTGSEGKVKMRGVSSVSIASNVTIRISGKLFQGHLAYLDQLVQSANDCELWPSLNLNLLTGLDRAALFFLMGGESRDFSLVACPDFIRVWMRHETMALGRTSAPVEIHSNVAA
jgi:hypothetical protein